MSEAMIFMVFVHQLYVPTYMTSGWLCMTRRVLFVVLSALNLHMRGPQAATVKWSSNSLCSCELWSVGLSDTPPTSMFQKSQSQQSSAHPNYEIVFSGNPYESLPSSSSVENCNIKEELPIPLTLWCSV